MIFHCPLCSCNRGMSLDLWFYFHNTNCSDKEYNLFAFCLLLPLYVYFIQGHWSTTAWIDLRLWLSTKPKRFPSSSALCLVFTSTVWFKHYRQLLVCCSGSRFPVQFGCSSSVMVTRSLGYWLAYCFSDLSYWVWGNIQKNNGQDQTIKCFHLCTYCI